MRNFNLRHKDQGSILLVIVIFLAMLTGLAVTFIQVPDRFPQIRHDHISLTTADHQLRSFMAFNGRLPCPDTNGDGNEDCAVADTKGNLPYLTLGLKEPGYASGNVALRYGLYRRADNTAVIHDSPFDSAGIFDPLGWFGNFIPTVKVTTYASDADLGVLKNRYEPTAADDLQFNTANKNTVDLCAALQNGAGAATDSTHTYISSTAAGQHNVAYAIAAAGYMDSDNTNGLFDGLNGSSAVGFNAPDTPISFSYDDQVLSRSFVDLQNDMQCDVVINSLNLMADALHTQLDVAAQSESIKAATILGAGMAGTTIVINTYDFVLTVVGAAAATAALTAATAAETAAIAACVVAVGCPEVPIMTAAVAAAVAAETASALGVVFSAAAVVAQVTATLAYSAIAVAANIVLPATDKMDLTKSINQVTQSLNTAQADLATAIAQATTDRTTATQSLNVANQTLNSISDSPTKTKTQAVFDALDVQTDAKKTYESKVTAWKSLQAKCDALISPGGTPAQCAAADSDWQTKQQSCYALNPPDPAAQICLDAKTAWNTRQTMCGNPGTTECADAAQAKSEVDQAKASLDAKTILVNNAQSAANTAAHASSDPSDPNRVQQAISQYSTAIKDDEVASAKEHEVANLTQQVADLTNSLAVMNCMQIDKFYDSATGNCTDQPNNGSTSIISFATGAESILKQADSLGTTQ